MRFSLRQQAALVVASAVLSVFEASPNAVADQPLANEVDVLHLPPHCSNTSGPVAVLGGIDSAVSKPTPPQISSPKFTQAKATESVEPAEPLIFDLTAPRPIYEKHLIQDVEQFARAGSDASEGVAQPNNGYAAPDAMQQRQAIDAWDAILNSRVVQEFLRLKEENMELKAQLKVEAVQAKAERTISELKLQSQLEHIERRERETQEQMRNLEANQREMERQKMHLSEQAQATEMERQEIKNERNRFQKNDQRLENIIDEKTMENQRLSMERDELVHRIEELERKIGEGSRARQEKSERKLESRKKQRNSNKSEEDERDDEDGDEEDDDEDEDEENEDDDDEDNV